MSQPPDDVDDSSADIDETDQDESSNQEDEWPDVAIDLGEAGCMLVIAQFIMMIVGYLSKIGYSQGSFTGTSEAPQAAINYLIFTTVVGLLLLYFYNRSKKQDPIILYTMPIVFLIMVLLLT